jgi:hypothetical protein
VTTDPGGGHHHAAPGAPPGRPCDTHRRADITGDTHLPRNQRACRTAPPSALPEAPREGIRCSVPANTSHTHTAVHNTVHQLARDVLEEAQHLTRILSRPDTPLLDPVEQAVRLSRVLETLTAELVGRAHQGGAPWQRLGPALAMKPDTARRTHSTDAIHRRPHSIPRLLNPPPATRPLTSDPTPASRQTKTHLSPVLAQLQHASQLSLTALADRTGAPSCHISHVLSGERFPSWQLTERFARACGADPQVLRKVWEDEKLREDHPRK